MKMYKNYLSEACSSELLAKSCVVNPRGIGNPVDLSFVYKIIPDLERLECQAKVFSELFVSKREYTETLERYISVKFDERIDVLKQTYIYSYLKSLFTILQIKENGYSKFGSIPENSLVFKGHGYLVHLFLNFNSFSPTKDLMSNLFITKSIIIDDNVRDIFANHPVFLNSQSIINPKGLFNPKYERVLEALRTHEHADVLLLGDSSHFPKDLHDSPLGNMAFSNDRTDGMFLPAAKSIATVTCYNSITDYNSKFFNIANFITIEELPEELQSIRSGCPYSYIPLSDESPITYIAQVSSITGIDINNQYSNFGASNPRSDFDPNASKPLNNTDGSSDHNISNNSRNRENRKGSEEQNYSNHINNNNNKNSVTRNQFSRIKSFVLDRSKGAAKILKSEVLRDEITRFCSNVLLQEINKRQLDNVVKGLKNTRVITAEKNNQFKIGGYQTGRNDKTVSFIDSN